MSEPSMIEKVARAIRKADAGRATNYGIDEVDALTLARTTIEAMREPTEAMMEAGNLPGCDDSVTIGLSEEIWKAMIDAALQEGKEGE